MSHPHPAGLLAAYNSLTDKHLAGYFNNTRIRRHLFRSGLITRNGRILSEKEYKVNIMKKDHQKYIRECLAQAIFHKVLDLERYHQLEIKRKLETSARKERIQRLKGEHTRRFVESEIPMLSPHPPAGPRTNPGHRVLADEGHSSPSTLTAPRPYTAPGNMQPPIRLQPLLRNHTGKHDSKFTPGPWSKSSLLEKEAPFPIGGKKAMMKFRNSMSSAQRGSAYQLPHINSYMMPMPPPPLPPPPPTGKMLRENRSETWRRRRFRPITAPNAPAPEPPLARDSGRTHKTLLHSNAIITMVYMGKNVHLSYDDKDFRDEIKVYQQHCGGENLCVYKGKLLEKDTFQFISKRHHGFPFSLTFFLNGIQVNRLSSCCEFKHRRSSRLGGKRGYFGFVCVEKASPCYKCIIAMGLDRKTSSVKPRKDKSMEKRGQGKLRKDRENMESQTNEMERDEASISAIFSAQDLMGVREVRTVIEEMDWKIKPGQDDWEEDHENTFKYDYEADFEVEEEQEDENANDDGEAADQMDGTSKPPTDSRKDDLGPEKESEISSEMVPDAEESDEEAEGCLGSEGEEDKQDIKTASSTTSVSHPCSSESEDDSSERDREAHTGNSTNESTRSACSQELNENEETGKPQLPAADSLETEIREQEITKANVEDRPLLTEDSSGHVPEEEIEKETPEIAEDVPEISRESALQEKKDESELWEGSTGQVKDRKAGLPRVEEAVGQIISEALVPGCRGHPDITSGVSSSEEGPQPTSKMELDSSGAPNSNFTMEERAAFNSDEESKHVVLETHTLEKKDMMEKDEDPWPGDAETRDKGGVAMEEKAGGTEIPLGKKDEIAWQAASATQLTEKGETPQSTGTGAEVWAAGSRRPGKEELSPLGKAGQRGSESLSGDDAAQEQASVHMGMETERAVFRGKQGLEKVLLTNSRDLSSQNVQQRDAMTPEIGEMESGEAEREAGSKMPTCGNKYEEETPSEPEDMGTVKDTGCEREDGSEETIHQAEELATNERALDTGPAMSSSTGDTEASRVEMLEGSPAEPFKDEAAREVTVTPTDTNREDVREETLPEELDIARGKAERPQTPPKETGSERGEMKRANTRRDDDTSEQKCKGDKRKGTKSEEETKASSSEKEPDADEEPRSVPELTKDTGLPRSVPELTEDTGLPEESLQDRMVTMSEATPQLEKSPGKRKARDTEHKGWPELLGHENLATSHQEREPHHDTEGGAPGSETSSNKAQPPEGTVTIPGEDEECARKELEDFAGLEKKGEKRQGEADALMIVQETAPEGEHTLTGNSSEEAEETRLEAEHSESTVGTGERKDSLAEGGRVLGGGIDVITENMPGGTKMPSERRGMCTDSQVPFPNVAGEGTRLEAEGQTAAEATVPVQGIVTVTSIGEAEAGTLPEPKGSEGPVLRLGQDQDRKETGTDSQGGAHQLGGAEEVGPGSPHRWPELSREPLEAMAELPVKLDSSGTCEEQPHAQHIEPAGASQNSKE